MKKRLQKEIEKIDATMNKITKKMNTDWNVQIWEVTQELEDIDYKLEGIEVRVKHLKEHWAIDD